MRGTRLRSNPWLVAVLAVGLAVRAILIPITHGQDFVVWDRASAATLVGTNVYAHHPHYPGGPFAYFPLFLYVELPFQWLAEHGFGTFLVLGKLPIVAADVACALLVAGELRRRGAGARTVALGAALFFLNPLVLYNSAYYGRFDSLGCALLLATLISLGRRGPGSRAWGWWLGLAVAAKTFPAFVALGLLRRAGDARVRIAVVAAAVVGLLSLPYLDTPRAFVRDLLVHDLVKSPQGLSWQYLLSAPLGANGAKALSFVLLAVFVVLAVWLVRITDAWVYAAAVLVAFLVTSKLVLEQYLTWPMCLLVVAALTVRTDRSTRLAAWVALAAFTLAGMVDNETWHPFGRQSFLAVLVAGVSVGFVVIAARQDGAPTSMSSSSSNSALGRLRAASRIGF